jgi:hypothetical protein
LRNRLLVGFLLLVASQAAAQRGPLLEVSLLPANSPPVGASVSARRLLGDAKIRELLLNGFPAAMRFRLELWRAGGLFDDLESTQLWEVLVRYDAYKKQYLVVRRQGNSLEDFGGFPTLEGAESVLDSAWPVKLKPERGGTRYYYNVVLDIETLSVSDLDEVQRWMSGELQPAVRGKRAPFSGAMAGFFYALAEAAGYGNPFFDLAAVRKKAAVASG